MYYWFIRETISLTISGEVTFREYSSLPGVPIDTPQWRYSILLGTEALADAWISFVPDADRISAALCCETPAPARIMILPLA